MNRGMRLILRATLLEALRRKDAWVLGILMSAFALVALSARLTGSTDATAGTFMLNLGFSLSVLFSHLLTVLLSGRQFPDETENRTLYPLLARPVSRRSLLLGKWLAGGLVGLITLSAFLLLTWAVTPPAQTMSPLTGLQFVLLLPFSLFWAAALAILLSLWLPRALALCTTLTLVLLGNSLATWLMAFPVFPHLLPRFGALHLATRFTDGAPPLPATDLFALIAYALIWILLCLTGADHRFRGRAL